MSDYLSWEYSFLAETNNQPKIIAGVDEVGRGALFGSVVAAAIVLPLAAIPELIDAGVKDSKKLSAKKRQQLVPQIQSKVLDWHVSEATVEEIDELNILQASLLAMKRSILALRPSPEICLIDGNFPIPNLAISQKTVVKGDQKSTAIAAASVLAKVWRDELISSLAEQYPEYDLAKNKGYPTAKHLAALEAHGVSPLHRKSFAPCKKLLI